MFARFCLSLSIMVCASIALVTVSFAQVPEVITYQGTLADSEGNPVDDETVKLTFRFFEEDGEEPLGGWMETHEDVPVDEGRFSVLIGEESNEPLPDALFDTAPVFLDVQVNDEPLTRVQLGSTPFALQAAQAARAADADRAATVAEGAAVRSLNGATDAVTLSEGENISITQDDNTLTISAAVPEGGLTAVTSDETLSGNGTEDEPLGLADGAAVRSLTAEDNDGDEITTLTGDAVVQEGTGITLGEEEGALTISLAGVFPDQETIQGNGTPDSPLSLARNGVISANIRDGEVKSDDLGAGAVVESRINNGAVSAPKLSPEVPDDGSGDQVLTYLDARNQMSWERPGLLRSSIRWKENVRPFDDALALVEQLRGVRYDWTESGEADVGVIAEEVAEVLPELVEFDDDGQASGVQYSKLVSVLIEAVKEQQQELESAREKASSLEERVERLERLLLQSDADNPSGTAAERNNRP